MNYFFITGTSKGLGKALVELLLNEENNVIYGFARNETVQHQRYIHTQIDLSDLNQVQAYEFPEIDQADRLILINNAGIVGDVQHVGKINNQQIIDCYQLNLIAPAILINNFLAQYASFKGGKMVLNISSGAGRTPIDGWNVYCSSKAGLDMFSQVLKEEIAIDKDNTKVLSLAPGIIDTSMQEEIRSSDEAGFSNIDRFIAYKKNGELTLPEVTAKQIYRFITEEHLTQNVLCSVRDLEE